MAIFTCSQSSNSSATINVSSHYTFLKWSFKASSVVHDNLSDFLCSDACDHILFNLIFFIISCLIYNSTWELSPSVPSLEKGGELR